MSESRNKGESRGYEYTPSYVSVSGESRNNSSNQVNDSKYNNLDDIDTLIEKLEKEKIETTCDNSQIQAQISKRKQKIEQLKNLRKQANEAREKAEILEKIKADNQELDEAIRSTKQLIKKPQPKTSDSNSKKGDTQYSRVTSFDYGESRDSGESRW